MSRKMPSTVNLRATLEGDDKLSTLRVDLSYGFRMPVIDGQPTFQGMWRADLTEIDSAAIRGRKRPKFLGTFCTDSSKEESPADLLRQLADIYEAGELTVSGLAERAAS